MNKYKKPIINEESLGSNPFIGSLVVLVNRISLDGKFKKDDEVLVPLELDVEYTPSCKVYADSGRRNVMIALTPRAKDLLLWFIYEVKNNKDWLWLNKKRYMEECGLQSVNTYKSALNDLIKHNFIGLTVIKDVFWINPHYIFNGNRVKCFQKQVKQV